MTSEAVRVMAGDPWLGIGGAMAAFLSLLAAVKVVAGRGRLHPEAPRKLLHAGSGLLTLAFPFVFFDVWPVVLLTGATALILAAVKCLPCCRRVLGDVVAGVERTTFGELYFPIAVALVFSLALGEPHLLFTIPILVLAIADSACAIVGLRYGRSRYVGSAKTLEGSAAFVVTAFFCIHVPLLLWSGVGRVEALLIAATLALILMLIEGSAPRGLDNLFIPVGSYFILRAFLSLDAGALLMRFVVTIGLIVLVMLLRRRTAVEDDKLLAGAFVCYLAGALVGWMGLGVPVLGFLIYAWLQPSTPCDRRFVRDAGRA